MSSISRHVMPDCFLKLSDRNWRMLLYSSIATLWNFNGPQWFASVGETVREVAIFHKDVSLVDQVTITTDVDSTDEIVKTTMAMLSQNKDIIDRHFNEALPIDLCDGNIVKLLPTSVFTRNTETVLESIDESKGTIIIADQSGS